MEQVSRCMRGAGKRTAELGGGVVGLGVLAAAEGELFLVEGDVAVVLLRVVLGPAQGGAVQLSQVEAIEAAQEACQQAGIVSRLDWHRACGEIKKSGHL